MKIELPSLDSEPILYFLLHSGVFVGCLALLFFLLGICMGATIWGRYKRQLALARAEIDSQLEELAMLKRRLAEQAVRPVTVPLNPPAALLTEVLPGVGQVFPERQPSSAAAPVAAAPASSAMPVSPPPASTGLNGSAAPPPAEAVLLELPEVAAIPAAASVPPLVIGGLPLGDATLARRPVIRVKRRPMPPPAIQPPEPDHAQANGTEPGSAVEPFGFLLGGGLPEAEPALPLSTLAAIVKGRALGPDLPLLPELEPLLPDTPDTGPPDSAGAAPDLPAPSSAAVVNGTTPPPGLAAPALSVPLEFDQALGLIYRQPPPDADDLAQIRGISTTLAARLNELGVHTYRQIAAWDENQVREFSQRLAFKDRIAREHWVEQARALNETQGLAREPGGAG